MRNLASLDLNNMKELVSKIENSFDRHYMEVYWCLAELMEDREIHLGEKCYPINTP